MATDGSSSARLSGVTMSSFGTRRASSTTMISPVARRRAACSASPAPNGTAVAMTSSAGPMTEMPGPASTTTWVSVGAVLASPSRTASGDASSVMTTTEAGAVAGSLSRDGTESTAP